MVHEILSAADRFFIILDHFLPIYPQKFQKSKILKKWKKTLEISSFYQGRIQRDVATGQPVWDPKFLSQINKKLKILKWFWKK